MTGEYVRGFLKVLLRSSHRERDLSWLDYSSVRDITADGQTVLFDESAAGGGAKYAVYIRRVDGSPAIRISDGVASALSHDNRWAICFDPHQNPSPLMIVPTGAGETRQIATPGLHHEFASWFPDGQSIVFTGVQSGSSRLYIQRLDGGSPRPITPQGIRITAGASVSPDGRLIAALREGRLTICRADAGQPPYGIPLLSPAARFIGWSTDPRFLYTAHAENWIVSIDRVEVSSGKMQHWTDIALTDLSGLRGRANAHITPDGNTIAYSFRRELTNLFLVDQGR